MGDWQPKRDDDNGTGRGNSDKKWDKYLADRKGMNRFDIALGIGVIEPDFSTTQPAKNFGGLWLNSFGVRKGREILSFGDWTKSSVESIVSLVRNEKAPRPITMLWSGDGRKNFFNGFKGKKLILEIDFSMSTPGSINVLHYKLTLNDCHITSVSPDYHKVDKTMTKFDRINATCGGVEFESAQ